MARLPRFFLSGVPLHVIHRGNNRSAIFAEDGDRSLMCAYMAYARRNCGVSIHAYVLMTNHVHLLLTPHSATSLPRFMQTVAGTYVRYFNAKYERTGTLWEGRYKAAIVDDEHYLLTCMRYIELNPVRAGMVQSPAEYHWSSFAANALGTADALVAPHPLYVALDRNFESRLAAYRELFAFAVSPDDLRSIRDATQNAWALGSNPFRERVQALARRAQRLPKGGARPKSPQSSLTPLKVNRD